MTDLGRLDERTRGEVLAAVAAVETSDAPVPARSYRALREGALREVVRQTLTASGRAVVELGDGFWTSGYDDAIADDMVREGLGQLDAADRAVLALVLLHTVAIPRATGRISSSDWTQAEAVDRDTLHQNRSMTNALIDRSLRRLQARGILRRGHGAEIRPGPQFMRISETRSRALWEDLVLLCRPASVQAATIKRRRQSQEVTR
jgi:hypothetical protein